MFLSDIVGDLSIEEVENSLRKVVESTDEMFAPSKNEREYQLLDNSSLIRLYKQTAKFARGRPANQKSLGQIAVELNRRGYPEPDTMLKHLYGKVKSAIKETETDDMFTTGPNLSQKLGDALLRYGDGVLMYADDLKTSKDPDTRDYVSELLSKGAAFIRAGKAFDAKGLQAGILEWVLVDREYREEFYNYVREVEDWNPEEVINKFMGLNEEDDMFAKRPEVSKHNQPFVNKPIIGSAKVRDDIDTAWDWGDDYQVDSIDELPYYEQKMIRSAGKTLPVVNLSDRGYLTVLLGPQQPFTLHVHFFRDIRVDHPLAVYESVDSELVIRISKVLRQKGYAVEQLISPSVVSTGLEHAVSLYKQWAGLTPDAQWNLLDDISAMMTNP